MDRFSSALGLVGEALFEANSDSLSEWTLVNPRFLPSHGGGGGLWHAMPPIVDPPLNTSAHRVNGEQATAWSHIMQLDGGGLADGGASFALMKVDSATSKLTSLSALMSLIQARLWLDL